MPVQSLYELRKPLLLFCLSVFVLGLSFATGFFHSLPGTLPAADAAGSLAGCLVAAGVFSVFSLWVALSFGNYVGLAIIPVLTLGTAPLAGSGAMSAAAWSWFLPAAIGFAMVLPDRKAPPDVLRLGLWAASLFTATLAALKGGGAGPAALTLSALMPAVFCGLKYRWERPRLAAAGGLIAIAVGAAVVMAPRLGIAGGGGRPVLDMLAEGGGAFLIVSLAPLLVWAANYWLFGQRQAMPPYDRVSYDLLIAMAAGFGVVWALETAVSARAETSAIAFGDLFLAAYLPVMTIYAKWLARFVRSSLKSIRRPAERHRI